MSKTIMAKKSFTTWITILAISVVIPVTVLAQESDDVEQADVVEANQGSDIVTQTDIADTAEEQPAQEPPRKKARRQRQTRTPRPVLYWGITDNGGAPAHTELSLVIRNELALNPDIQLIEGLTVMRISRERERLGQDPTGSSLPPDINLPDSTIMVKGMAIDQTFTIRRHWLLWGKIEARMSVRFSMSGVNGENAYHGEFGASAKKVKDFLLFRSAPKVVHISAKDRAELTKNMQAQLIKDITKVTTRYFDALATGDVDDIEDANVNENNNEGSQQEPATVVDVETDTQTNETPGFAEVLEDDEE